MVCRIEGNVVPAVPDESSTLVLLFIGVFGVCGYTLRCRKGAAQTGKPRPLRLHCTQGRKVLRLPQQLCRLSRFVYWDDGPVGSQEMTEAENRWLSVLKIMSGGHRDAAMAQLLAGGENAVLVIDPTAEFFSEAVQRRL
jgi:hypothetical protein